MAELYANNFTTFLGAACDTDDVTLTVGAAAPAALQGGQFRIAIGSELLLVTAGEDTTTWTVTRGIEGTTPAAHAGGATVSHVLTAASLAAAIPTGVAVSDLPAATAVAPADLLLLSQGGVSKKATASLLPGAEVDYAQITSPVTVTNLTATPDLILTGAAVEYDGSTRFLVEFSCMAVIMPTAAPGQVGFKLWEVGVGQVCVIGYLQGQYTMMTARLAQVITPSAGTHQYAIYAYVGTAGNTATVSAGTGSSGSNAPAFMRITRA